MGEGHIGDAGDCIVVYTGRALGVHSSHTAAAVGLPVPLLPVVLA